ncbi:MAG: carboxylating nicotinate-nucleotide diphosphorylase [Gemmatimonadaceae bacterium]
MTAPQPAHAARLRFPLAESDLDALVRAALTEDHAFRDVTTLATVREDAVARARMVARADGVIAGLPIALATFQCAASSIDHEIHAPDGTPVARGTNILSLEGPARALLAAERVALNFVQHLSGIATLTARYVDAVRGTHAQILDTRKTTHGWRALEKYAVRCGGGVNHRADLEADVLIKDNHLAALDGDVALAVHRTREIAPAGVRVEVECDDLEQVRAAVAAHADIILLDNMSPALMRECVQLIAGRALTEASGGISLDTVRAVAESGVDRISVGALTHSAPALDIGLDFTKLE